MYLITHYTLTWGCPCISDLDHLNDYLCSPEGHSSSPTASSRFLNIRILSLGEQQLLTFSQVVLLPWAPSCFCSVYQALDSGLLPDYHPKAVTPTPDKNLGGSHLSQWLGIAQWANITICCWLTLCTETYYPNKEILRGLPNLVLPLSWVFQTKTPFHCWWKKSVDSRKK